MLIDAALIPHLQAAAPGATTGTLVNSPAAAQPAVNALELQLAAASCLHETATAVHAIGAHENICPTLGLVSASADVLAGCS